MRAQLGKPKKMHAIHVPTLHEARLKAAGGDIFDRLLSGARKRSLVDRVLKESETQVDLINRVHTVADSPYGWPKVCRGFRYHVTGKSTCPEWPEIVTEAASALVRLGADIPHERLLASPEALYIGLVEAFVADGFKVHVTDCLPHLLAAEAA
jgi:hypothetical protein